VAALFIEAAWKFHGSPPHGSLLDGCFMEACFMEALLMEAVFMAFHFSINADGRVVIRLS